MPISRRRFIRQLSLGAASVPLSYSALQACGLSTADSQKKLGIALVGLGSYSSYQLAPALQQTQHTYLAGIVTGTPAKAQAWAAKYNIPAKNVYDYQNFDRIADNPDIDIVYVVLPIFLHKEFTLRAAKAGKHVICEKPMAMNVEECTAMIEGCKAANRLLSIGYRLHFEPFTQEMMRLGQQKVFGNIRNIEGSNGFTWGGPTNLWRLKKDLAGGGALMDMGVYVVQGARYVTGMEPLYVQAREEKLRPEVFSEVDETVYWTMEFPGGITATCKTSYNAGGNFLKVEADKGSFELSAAYRYGGMAGKTSLGPMTFDPNVNQQAAQMDDFARCILDKKPTRVPGEMGRQDMKVIEAIYRSLASGAREQVAT